jgi:hypothetical protein
VPGAVPVRVSLDASVTASLVSGDRIGLRLSWKPESGEQRSPECGRRCQVEPQVRLTRGAATLLQPSASGPSCYRRGATRGVDLGGNPATVLAARIP